MAPELAAFLCEGMAAPFDHGAGFDCSLWPCTWVQRRTGIDPAANLRGTYFTAAGALRVTRAWGGFETMWRTHMAMAGFSTTHDPREGDVGMLRDTAGQSIAGICLGATWAAKARRGVLIEAMHVVVAWSIPACHSR